MNQARSSINANTPVLPADDAGRTRRASTCSSTGMQARYESLHLPRGVPLPSQVDAEHEQEQERSEQSFLGLGENRRHRRQTESAHAKRFSFQDFTKFVTTSISMIDGARGTITKGSVLLGKIIDDIDALRITLLDDDTSSVCKKFAFREHKLVEPEDNPEIWCLCDFKDYRQISSENVCLDSGYELDPRPVTDSKTESKVIDRRMLCKWDKGKCLPKNDVDPSEAEIYDDEMGTPSLMAQGINNIDTLISELKEHIDELNNTANRHLDSGRPADEGNPIDNLHAALKKTKFMERLQKIMLLPTKAVATPLTDVIKILPLPTNVEMVQLKP